MQIQVLQHMTIKKSSSDFYFTLNAKFNCLYFLPLQLFKHFRSATQSRNVGNRGVVTYTDIDISVFKNEILMSCLCYTHDNIVYIATC